MKSITLFVLGVIKRGDTYLLTKRIELDPEDAKSFHGAWQLPGGGVQFGETVENAIRREIREELGVESKVIRLVPHIIDAIRPTWHGIGLAFVCDFIEKNPRFKLNEEASEYSWFTMSEVKNIKTLPDVLRILRLAEEKT